MRCSLCSHHPAALAEPRGTLVTLVEPWWNPRGTSPQARPGPPRSLSGLRPRSFQLLGKKKQQIEGTPPISSHGLPWFRRLLPQAPPRAFRAPRAFRVLSACVRRVRRDQAESGARSPALPRELAELHLPADALGAGDAAPGTLGEMRWWLGFRGPLKTYIYIYIYRVLFFDYPSIDLNPGVVHSPQKESPVV